MTELDYKDKSSAKAWDYSMLGTVQSEGPKRSLPPKFQGVQQEHDLSASPRGLEYTAGEKLQRPQWGKLLLGNKNTPCTT